jgi:hypothetical protein
MNKHGDREKLNAERKAYISRGHTVISHYVDEGTQILRDLVGEVGVRPAARMLGEDWAEVAGWTRKGLPEGRWVEVQALYREHRGSSISLPQDPGFDGQAQFTVAR